MPSPLLLLLLVAVFLGLASADQTQRIVVVADLHGDYTTARKIFIGANVMAPDGNWTGGNTILVQTGDVVDRGPDAHGIYDMIMRMQRTAPHHGGRVIMLLGNHELMNLKGDWAFVDHRDTEAFGSKEKREAAYSSSGLYGRFIRGLPMVATVGSVVFVHGGLSAEYSAMGVAKINELAKSRIAAADWEAGILMGDGPVWNRDVLRLSQVGECKPLRMSLQALSKAEGKTITHMVVGHTAQLNGAMGFFCRSLAAADVLASAYYAGGGHASYLEIALEPSGRFVKWEQVTLGRTQLPANSQKALTRPSTTVDDAVRIVEEAVGYKADEEQHEEHVEQHHAEYRDDGGANHEEHHVGDEHEHYHSSGGGISIKAVVLLVIAVGAGVYWATVIEPNRRKGLAKREVDIL